MTSAAEPLPLLVHLDNRIGVEERELAGAREVVIEVFRAAGVEVRWSDEPSDSPSMARGPQRVSVMLARVEEGKEGAPLSGSGCILGLAVPSRDRAFVFYNRIVHAARALPVDLGAVLGRAIAHEIGHLLMPPGRHSSFGIMRGELDFEYSNPSRFSADEARRIRDALRTRRAVR